MITIYMIIILYETIYHFKCNQYRRVLTNYDYTLRGKS